MFLKINTAKTLIQIGYSKQEIADSRTEEKDKDGNDVITFGFDSGYSCVECSDEDENVWERIQQLQDYWETIPVTGSIYNIKWSDTKDTFVMTTDVDGKSVKEVESVEKDEDPESETFGEVIKTNYKMSHFSGDDSAKDARLLANEWKLIRRERDRLLANSDWTQANDTALASAKVTAWATYRTKLRDVPKDQKDKTTYASITWPSEPS